VRGQYGSICNTLAATDATIFSPYGSAARTVVAFKPAAAAFFDFTDNRHIFTHAARSPFG